MSRLPDPVEGGWCLPRRLCYVVECGLPFNFDDRALRSHEIARAMAAHDFEVIVFQRPGRPWDLPGHNPFGRVALDQMLEGVRYISLPAFDRNGLPAGDSCYMAERVLQEAMQVFRPATIMASADIATAAVAAKVARRLKTPFLYEADRLAELPEQAGEPNQEQQDKAGGDWTRQAGIVDQAAAVFVPAPNLQEQLVARGVSRDRIRLVSHGVRTRPRQVPILRRSQVQCTARRLLGYVGALDHAQGVEDMVQLVALLRANGVDAAALFVDPAMAADSDGEAVERLRQLAREHTVAEHAHLAPPVEPAAIGGFFALCDAMIFPRTDAGPGRYPAPLMPFRVAEYGVPVFMADNPVFASFASDIHAGLFPEGDLADLAGQLGESFAGDPVSQMEQLPSGTRWKARVQPLVEIMAAIAGKKAARLPVHLVGALTTLQSSLPPFDFEAIPEAVFAAERVMPVAGIGPCLEQRATATAFTRLSRTNLYSHLALAPPGILMVDWAGMHSGAASEEDAEWADLWSIADMRLNRQMMDACRIAANRGWQLVVLGPIHGSAAPLFRTVSGLFEVVSPFVEEIE